MAKKQEGKTSNKAKETFEEVLNVLKDFDLGQSGSSEPTDPNKLLSDLEDQMMILQQQSEKLYAATGMSKEQLKAYAENQDNFTPDQWKLLNDVRSEMERFQHEAERIMESSIDQPVLTTRRVTQGAVTRTKKATPRKKRIPRSKWRGV